MLFNGLTFVVYFALIMLVYYSLSQWKMRKGVLLVASYLFYAAWNPPFVVLLWISTALDWFVGKWIGSTQKRQHKMMGLVASLAVNLGLLAYYKYGTFMVESLQAMLALWGVNIEFASSKIILPVGISFYTFQTLSYTLDIYRGKARPEKSFLNFALFVTFFPQLVAGPIVRAVEFLPQCQQIKAFNWEKVSYGLFLMTFGLFQKIVLADVLLAPTANAVFNHVGAPLATLDAWVGVMAFSGQIFFDFAGYSTCAIGAALCLGFELPQNFRAPYAAVGFSDFWRRWHITLSTWLRDYLYIPLGGNRQGMKTTLLALIFTMALGGLWHGAAWNFVLWGLLHGLFLVGERVLRKALPLSNKVSWRAVTLLGVCLAWVFFRTSDVASALSLFQSLFFGLGLGAQAADMAAILPSVEILKTSLVFLFLVTSHVILAEKISLENFLHWPQWAVSGVWSLFIFFIVIAQGGGNAFIYFQF